MRYPSAALPILCVLGSLASAQEPTPQLPPELETYIANALREWDVPGAALEAQREIENALPKIQWLLCAER